MRQNIRPSFRDVAAKTFQAIGPCRIAALTIYALRRADLGDGARGATARQAVTRLQTAHAMLVEGFSALLAQIDLEEPPEVVQARQRAQSALDAVLSTLAGADGPAADAMPDAEAFRALCIDRIDPEISAFLDGMTAFLNNAQQNADRHYGEDTRQTLDQARSVGRSIQMVALNATIEAARMGSDGRGFVVIADEVKALADRTQTLLHDVASRLDR